MSGHNVNIYFPEETYQKIKPLIEQRKVSAFVNQAVKKELEELEKKLKKEKEQLKQRLIEVYQDRNKNEKLKKILRVYGEMSWEDISTELAAREKNNVKFKK